MPSHLRTSYVEVSPYRISYAKGASIIRMMDHFLTTETFRKGLAKYLRAL